MILALRTLCIAIGVFCISTTSWNQGLSYNGNEKDEGVGWVDINTKLSIIKTIVIDPGHGGKDSGCLGKNSKEKEIALSIGLLLRDKLEKEYPGLKVIMTRDSDVFIPLHERAEIANENKADLFVSIHCNSIVKPHIKGSETYVMGLHTAAENLEVAKRENTSILMEDNFRKHYGDYDPYSPEGHIFMTMYQNIHLDQSLLFAERVEYHIDKCENHESRGVKQAGFLVLRATAMPSVLVETGYLTNKGDNAFLLTKNGQQEIAESLLNAFSEYKLEIEKENNLAFMALSELENAEPKPIEKPIIKEVTVVRVKQSVPVNIPTKPKEEKILPEFMVQLGAFSSEKDLSSEPWSGISNLIHQQENNIHKYLVNGFGSESAAVEGKSKLQELGFHDAFLVASMLGKRISLKEARQYSTADRY